ncbi:Vi polysaccharide biosynthesis protein VipB/TviC [Tamlana sedimentorum]|uniref:Vi polysaccharide biosynthesis protein VipB/TviC n=1 Tax=Neotamlana sedimentorum TaxID=1435349 RepID=A0A0D7WCG4_9FLAO|nr:SDR family oxidoreductase [Tamlana sedimentorum]KJD36754.1 Vi polysaccharide biosynthesis protein VipB/TviC [Tamlana sedimentorum]
MYENKYHDQDLSQYSFLVTGGAGFIGSNLVEYLLKYNAKQVVILDNLETGLLSNIEHFIKQENCTFIEGDICDLETCQKAVEGVDFILHQAALGSVPRSIKNPIKTNEVNVTGFLNMLMAAIASPTLIKMVYAASSSTYGDHPDLPKVEDKIGNPLSPYAVTKYINELYANVFNKTYDLQIAGLRYFNVFGPKQQPNGAYAAVIPLFFKGAINNSEVKINGDGEQTRDFTYIENVVQANIKALFAEVDKHEVYNVAFGERISINKLWETIKAFTNSQASAEYGPTRVGDVKNSLANIEKAKNQLQYNPLFNLQEGLQQALKWYLANN